MAGQHVVMASTARSENFAPLPDDQRARWQVFPNWSQRVVFPGLVGLQLEEVRVDYARLRLPYRPELDQPAGIVHGGAIATLVDTVVVPAINGAYAEMRPLFTIDMQLRYLSPAREVDLVAEGWVVKRGRSIVFCDVEVLLPDGSVSATATLTYKVGTGNLQAPDSQPSA